MSKPAEQPGQGKKGAQGHLPRPNGTLGTPLRGYIYVIRNTDGSHSIGITSRPDERLRLLNAGRTPPLPFEILAECADSIRTELKLHQQFAACRIRRGCYALTPDDLAVIRGLLGV